ncbi:hypothetical protein CC85DRAFT_292185 [Cutaneotrichosporon oleaginosum]|uniref:Uncharacterized protein n=1 Tax=Cutaneotrichosporon oleaginosum TaxID=879819 RepID=A0A0J1B3M9_9TREE|nr:uncharacterized protein CC85DRAFT_292185 [Cutaneotrichosporon oleaginosum]KLT42254.1 hypothetical protein CC85DRAFT_292185 [Cutaneotrichosporon oleaginosum]TXT11426.1 hypothetical protein COLE_01836 [Cutaneotrichosporon oleaginosum]
MTLSNPILKRPRSASASGFLEFFFSRRPHPASPREPHEPPAWEPEDVYEPFEAVCLFPVPDGRYIVRQPASVAETEDHEQPSSSDASSPSSADLSSDLSSDLSADLSADLSSTDLSSLDLSFNSSSTDLTSIESSSADLSSVPSSLTSDHLSSPRSSYPDTPPTELDDFDETWDDTSPSLDEIFASLPEFTVEEEKDEPQVDLPPSTTSTCKDTPHLGAEQDDSTDPAFVWQKPQFITRVEQSQDPQESIDELSHGGVEQCAESVRILDNQLDKGPLSTSGSEGVAALDASSSTDIVEQHQDPAPRAGKSKGQKKKAQKRKSKAAKKALLDARCDVEQLSTPTPTSTPLLSAPGSSARFVPTSRRPDWWYPWALVSLLSRPLVARECQL